MPLLEPPRGGAWVESEPGVTAHDDAIEVEAGWTPQLVAVAYRVPPGRVSAERIDELKRLLDAMSNEQRRTIAEVEASRFSPPVLSVSHRWDDPVHPLRDWASTPPPDAVRLHDRAVPTLDLLNPQSALCRGPVSPSDGSPSGYHRLRDGGRAQSLGAGPARGDRGPACLGPWLPLTRTG